MQMFYMHNLIYFQMSFETFKYSYLTPFKDELDSEMIRNFPK